MTDSRSATSRGRRGLVARSYGAVAATLIGLSLLFGGCFGGNTLERSYFSLEYPVEHCWSYETPRYPMMVRVQRFDSAMAYDRQEMVYRNNPHEFQYYWYKLWASKPRKMLRELVASHLRQTNLFQSVVLDIGDTLPDYDLRVEIKSIEELDATAEQWYAHLAMRLALVRYEDGVHVWEYDFDERKQVYNRQPVYVVRALSEIMEEQMNKAFEEIDAYLAEETGAAAPRGGPHGSGGGGAGGARATETDAVPSSDSPEPAARLKKRK